VDADRGLFRERRGRSFCLRHRCGLSHRRSSRPLSRLVSAEIAGETMAPRVDPVQSDEVLPAQADVVVIGGGIIGTSTALFLAQRGISVALCEKGHIAGEQSSRNWGWCRKMARDPREIPLIIESLRLWERMNETVEAETGFRTCGIMYLGQTKADVARYEAWLEHAREYQLDTRII